MTHAARGLIALIAVVVLALVGQREATAEPCKADGDVCPRNRSCCGTSGNDGVCVKAPGARFGTCCTPTGNDTNCDGRDDDCDGVADDGYVPAATTCGTGNCASTGSLICDGGTTRDTCVPGTPDCTGKECGDDGCGGSCGQCMPPAVCDANGHCADEHCRFQCTFDAADWCLGSAFAVALGLNPTMCSGEEPPCSETCEVFCTQLAGQPHCRIIDECAAGLGPCPVP